MPKQLAPDLLERVTTYLARRSEGHSLAEIEAFLKGTASRRSIQRRLDEWMRSGAIRAVGVRRGRRYFNIRGVASPRPPYGVAEAGQPGRPKADSEVAPTIPISTSADEVPLLVHRSIVDRPPVGYRREFLEGYKPNETPYLSEALRSHLHELGRTFHGQRPAGTYARDILNRLLIELSWSSSRLEGNTYSLPDTRELIEKGTVAAGKDAKETQMILNHKAAIEFLVESAEEVGVNQYTVTNLHALLADNLLDEPRNAGRLRRTPIGIGASTYIPTAIPQLIEDSFRLLLKREPPLTIPLNRHSFSWFNSHTCSRLLT